MKKLYTLKSDWEEILENKNSIACDIEDVEDYLSRHPEAVFGGKFDEDGDLFVDTEGEYLILDSEIITECTGEIPLSEAERELYYVVKGNGGSFQTKLFELICAADLSNQNKLKKAFSEFTVAVMRYQSESGYWESIVNRMNK